MSSGERVFTGSVKKYCRDHGIDIRVESQGWLIVMTRGDRTRCAFGYDLGLNSAVAHRIASDKAATAQVLDIRGIPCVPHTLFLRPTLHNYIPAAGSWQAMLDLLRERPEGIIVKPNEGTGGNSVFRVTNGAELERAAHKIFGSEKSLAISPYLDIEDEVRVVLIDEQPLVVYRKSRPSIVGDGTHSYFELAVAAIPAKLWSAVLPAMVRDLDRGDLDKVVPAGERRLLNWRHNLGAGSQPVVLEADAAREACVELARKAAAAVGTRFASIDVVRVAGRWMILEINSGVMMEALNSSHPQLVHAVYSAALDRLFA